MYSINSVTIVGHLGADADIRNMQNGQKVATMSIATDHSYKDKQSGVETPIAYFTFTRKYYTKLSELTI